MVICVTNRGLCNIDYFERLRTLAEKRPRAIILREKDLSEAEYYRLAERAYEICREYGTTLIINGFVDIALQLGIKNIHLSMSDFKTKLCYIKGNFNIKGVSVHSVAEAIEAERLGADYIIAGHIFVTDCKKGLEPRGLEFLEEVCKGVSIPVYAIGGINNDNTALAIAKGATGVCVMSGAMNGGYRF